MTNKILITGCARSGTKFSSYALHHCSIHMPHERYVGQQGIVTWGFFSSPKRPSFFCSDRLEETPFAKKYLQIRNPQDCISSLMTNGTWDYPADILPELKGLRKREEQATVYWILWNTKLLKHVDESYNLNSFEKILNQICKHFSMPILTHESYQRLVQQKINTRNHPEVDHEKLVPKTLQYEYDRLRGLL